MAQLLLLLPLCRLFTVDGDSSQGKTPTLKHRTLSLGVAHLTEYSSILIVLKFRVEGGNFN